MRKKATIVISLVKQADSITNHRRLENEIRESLRCDWLAEVEKVTVKPRVQIGHAMPSGEEVKARG
jgi:hypothetical protein